MNEDETLSKPEDQEPTAGDGEALLQERCTACHGLERTTSELKTWEQWEQTVDRMIDKGGQLDEQESTTLIDYLAATYGP